MRRSASIVGTTSTYILSVFLQYVRLYVTCVLSYCSTGQHAFLLQYGTYICQTMIAITNCLPTCTCCLDPTRGDEQSLVRCQRYSSTDAGCWLLAAEPSKPKCINIPAPQAGLSDPLFGDLIFVASERVARLCLFQNPLLPPRRRCFIEKLDYY